MKERGAMRKNTGVVMLQTRHPSLQVNDASQKRLVVSGNQVLRFTIGPNDVPQLRLELSPRRHLLRLSDSRLLSSFGSFRFRNCARNKSRGFRCISGDVDWCSG